MTSKQQSLSFGLHEKRVKLDNATVLCYNVCIVRAIFRHTIRFYDTLDAKAVEEDGIRVFRGHPTTIVTEEMKLPIPYYSKMRQALITIGCIQQIKRGSAKSKSEWVLVRRPEDADFDSVDPDESRNIDANTFRLYQLATDAALATIEQRLGGLDVARALVDMQQEIDDLKRQLKTKESNSGVRV